MAKLKRPDQKTLELKRPKVYTKSWSFKESVHLLPDTELLEYICNENEKDLKHLVREP
jgi:hypothetical protein